MGASHPVLNGNAAYAATRAGVTMPTRAMAVDHARDAILANLVMPGARRGQRHLQHLDHRQHPPDDPGKCPLRFVESGVNALTRTEAMEFAAEGIRVSAIPPGGVDTEGSRQMRSAGLAATGPMMQVPQHFPLGRLARPVELTQAVLFLASPAASYITAALLPVDGDYTVS